MSTALVVGGTRGIGAVIARRFEADGIYVAVMGSKTPPLVVPPLSSIVFCQRYRGDRSAWQGEIETSLLLTRNIIENAPFDGENNSIVILSSIIAHTVADEQPLSYHMCKSALEGMIRYYAVALGPRGIRVNGVAPGVTLKPENAEYYQAHQDKMELFERINPLGRMGTADDVANVVSWLCSPGASFVTGQTIVVDGGVSLINQEALARSFLTNPISGVR